MRPHISLITLGVDDLERSVAFYRDGLGLRTQGIMGTEFAIGAVAFFELESGLRLALWPRASLAADAGLPLGPSAPTNFSLAHNVASQSEVDATYANDGCIAYDVAEDPFDPGLIRFSELLPSHESLAKHLQAPHIKPWRAAAHSCGLLERKFTAYDITGVRAV